jgi:hypothetical protein
MATIVTVRARVGIGVWNLGLVVVVLQGSMELPMDCADVERRLWEYLDAALSPKEAAAVRAHLDDCCGCGPTCRCCREFLRLLKRARRSQAGAPEVLRVRLQVLISQDIRTSR